MKDRLAELKNVSKTTFILKTQFFDIDLCSKQGIWAVWLNFTIMIDIFSVLYVLIKKYYLQFKILMVFVETGMDVIEEMIFNKNIPFEFFLNMLFSFFVVE